MLGSFLIFLREGVEGSMICAILLTYLAAGGRRDLFRWVVGGALLAAGLSALAGTGLYLTIRTAFVGSTAQTWVETGTFVVAVGVLTYMTFWMKGNARSMVGSLRTRAHQADSSAVLPDDGRPGLTGAVGDILHGLLGYASSPTALQLATYAIFLAVGLTLFLRTPTRSLSRG